jgi:alanine racemase
MDLSYLNGKSKGKYALVMDDAEVLAKKWNTIPYEVLVSVTKRAKRIYLE